MIVGTAGHIDHGKTTLVRALTGVDTDRLPEEKRRGITIDLGFAPLEIDGLGTVGVVDVPGHEAFVRTMLAGAAGIDVGLLVIAADDGVQPQTREHLAILELLGVRGGVVALTKCDLVERDWADLVEDEIAALVRGTAFAGAPVVRVVPGDDAAIAAIRTALAAALQNSDVRDPGEPFRLPVDRVFTIRGTGTVVTGTAWSGSLSPDDDVRILPAGRTARVRAVQVHGSEVSRALPGQRTAIALVGVDVADVHRGDVIAVGESWEPSSVIRADVRLLPTAPKALGPRTAVRFHLGTREVAARIVARGGPISPDGELRPARIALDAPIVARAGDRFVIRSASPSLTIGGGTVTDAVAPRRARPFPEAGMLLEARLSHVLDEAGVRGLPSASITVRLARKSSEIALAIQGSGAVASPGGQFLMSAEAFADARTRFLDSVDSFHRAHPLATGAPLQELRTRLGVAPEFAEELVGRGLAAGELETAGGEVRRSGWKPALTAEEERAIGSILAAIAGAGKEPPSVAELSAEYGDRTADLLRVAVGRGDVVQVEAARCYTPANLQRIIDDVDAAVAVGEEISPAQVRELLGVSRKYLIPLLEYFDRAGVTARLGDARVWRGRRAAP